jgi:hypothetical protein
MRKPHVAKHADAPVKVSSGAMHARAAFQEAKHKRDASGKFADMPGTENAPKGGLGHVAGGTPSAPKEQWLAEAKTAKVLGTDQIKIHVTSNPKKAGSASAERFAHYKDGMTADDFIAAGGLREDLAWDRKKNFISIHDPINYSKLSGHPGTATAEISPHVSGRLADIKKSVEQPPANLKEAAAAEHPAKPAAHGSSSASTPGAVPKAEPGAPAGATPHPKAAPEPAGTPAAKPPKNGHGLSHEDVLTNAKGTSSLSVGDLHKSFKAQGKTPEEADAYISSHLELGNMKVKPKPPPKPAPMPDKLMADHAAAAEAAKKPEPAKPAPTKLPPRYAPEDKINAYGDEMTVAQWKKNFGGHMTDEQAQAFLDQRVKHGMFSITKASPAAASTAQKAADAEQAALTARKLEAEQANKVHIEQTKPPEAAPDKARWDKATAVQPDVFEKDGIDAHQQAMEDTRKKMGMKFVKGGDNESINEYSAEGYESINGTLREKTYADLSPSDKKHTDELDRLISESETKADGVMWRGVQDFKKNHKNLNNMPPPSEFTDLGYSSMSFSPRVAGDFAGQTIDGTNVVFKIRVPKGTKALHIANEHNESIAESLNDGEAEAITARGTRFKYISTTKAGAKIHGQMHDVIELEVVHNNGKAVKETIQVPKQMPNTHRYKFDELTDLHPDKMVDEGAAGLTWEYEKEYLQYGGKNWGPGIKDQADFNKRYKAAPLTYLSASQYDTLDYTNVDSKRLMTFDEVDSQIGHRRDPAAIRDRMHNGVTTPPIVLRKNGKLRLMAGQSRIWTGLASGFRVPVKVIDV